MSEIGDCFRCGWCGQPTNCDGVALSYGEVAAMDVDWDSAIHTNGTCCQHGLSIPEPPRIVTREMAMDAGDLRLEGTEY